MRRFDELPDLLTVLEFQAFTRTGRKQSYAWAQVHGVRIGRSLRIPKLAVERWLEGGAAPAEGSVPEGASNKGGHHHGPQSTS